MSQLGGEAAAASAEATPVKTAPSGDEAPQGLALDPMKSVVRRALSKYDVDNSGTLDDNEMKRALEDMVAKELGVRAWGRLLLAAVS